MQKYSCKNCDAELYWNSQKQALTCDYCGKSYFPYEFETQTNNVQAEEVKNELFEKTTDDSEGLEYLKYQCSNCGAEVITVKGTVATTCAYCGRALSMTDKLVNNFKPHAVIPFVVSRVQAFDIYKQYCKGFLVPKEFKNPENIKKTKGIYAPFWLHSFQEDANTELLCTRSHSHRRGNDKVVTTQEYKVNMDVTAKFEKIPADALKNLDNSLMSAIEPFDYSKLEDFNAAYMAGYYAEEYNEDALTTFDYAYKRAVEAVQEGCRAHVKGYDTSKVVSYDGKYSNRKASYVMLPVWLINTEYKNKSYTFAINGSTGKITGRLPMSKIKLAITLASTLFGSYLIQILLKMFASL